MLLLYYHVQGIKESCNHSYFFRGNTSTVEGVQEILLEHEPKKDNILEFSQTLTRVSHSRQKQGENGLYFVKKIPEEKRRDTKNFISVFKRYFKSLFQA